MVLTSVRLATVRLTIRTNKTVRQQLTAPKTIPNDVNNAPYRMPIRNFGLNNR